MDALRPATGFDVELLLDDIGLSLLWEVHPIATAGALSARCSHPMEQQANLFASHLLMPR